jgi:sugar phosphate isomerase/epimerase
MSYKIGMPTLLELRSLDATVAFCKEMRLSLIELNMTRPEFLPPSLPPDKLREISDRDGIEFTLHLPEEVDLASFHDEVRDAWIRNMVKTVKWAADCGIVNATMHLSNGIYYTMPGGKVWLYNEYMDLYLQRLGDALKTIRSQAGGLCLCVENCGNFGHPFIRRALDENAMDITWDVGHDAESGLADAPYILERTERVKHMHLHDARDGKAHQRLYSGKVNVNEALRFARERQLRVIIEVKTVESLRQSVEELSSRHRSPVLSEE